jgi:hypothetical protein
MIKKINKYLLTHYPLLWNTKIVWVLLINIIIHISFLFAGILSTHADQLHNYSYLGKATVHVFSVLCSIAVLIFWLVFYLRNNSFKNFYKIDKFHLIKESLIVILIIFTSITYYEAFFWGSRIETRAITSKAELVQEANTINLAMTFIPQEKEKYFILNKDTTSYVPEMPPMARRYETDNDAVDDDSTITVDSVKANTEASYSSNADYTDTVNFPLRDSGYMKIRAALKLPDAFSYNNYCTVTIDLSTYPGYMPLSTWYTIKNRWIANGQRDSIRNVLDQFKTICRKYGVYNWLSTDALTNYVFVDPNHNINKIIPETEYNDQKQDVYYFETYPLHQSIDSVTECYSDTGWDYYSGDFVIEIFLTLCFSIVLLSYRWYSKKVFLISVIGTIVWCIIFGLLTSITMDGTIVSYSFLILFGLFTFIGIAYIGKKRRKVLLGVFLNWSCYGVPYVFFAITEIMRSYYYGQFDLYPDRSAISERAMHKAHPICYWVQNHDTLIYHANLVFVFLFIVFCYSRFSKKWHMMPEE